MRILTLNLWGENGPWQARLAVVAETLASLAPDVVTLQEVREVPGRVPNQAASLAAPRGYHHVFAPSTAWGGGHEGLAILSRFPIGVHQAQPLPHSAENEGRILLSARIDSDAGAVWVHTTHLSFREHEGCKREDQLLAIDEVVTARKAAAADNPRENPQILAGDFNATPSSDEIRWLTGLTSLNGRRTYYQDAWEILHPGEPGWTWARANPYTDRMHWLRSDRRLDYIFVTPVRRDRRGTVRSSRVVLDRPAGFGGGGGEPLYASDHFGVMADVDLQAQVAEPVIPAPVAPPGAA
jgi:endonuclease/exonuclease/phosphatase family metal-dependent hydrolase